ncbi:MAG TPA: helix-turn-helix domain-containing protein [Patescibacteria group bacterium]|nr:helix-turn-helix domain-containing protein [Patescibacteria group bacterium]
MSNQIKVSPSVASLLFGISERSIRRAIKNQEIKAVVVNSRYKIDFEDLLAWSNKLPNRQQKRDTLGLGQYVSEWKKSE